MAWPLRQSTASQEIPLGPFVDSTDGNTAKTALTIANTDIKLQKGGATTEANKNSGGATHIASGRYYAVLDATDTDTLGPLRISVHVAGALPVWLDGVVYPAAVYDALFAGSGAGLRADLISIAGATVATGSAQLGVNVVNVGGSAVSASAGLLNANVTQISGDAAAADNLEAAADGTGYNLGGGSIVAASVTGAVGSVAGAVGSVTGNVGGNVVGSVGSVVGAVGSVTGAVGSVTGNVGGNVVGSVGSVAGAVASVTGNVGGNVAGSVGSVTATVSANVVSANAAALDAAAFAADVGEEFADALLNRNVAGGSNVGRLVKYALYRLINRVRAAAGVLSTYDVDDTTVRVAQTITTTAGDPVSELDTTSP